MPRLYNPKRVPCPVTLRDGSSTSIPGKGYLTVPAEQWGSADVIRKVKKGLLVQKKDLPVAPPEQPKPKTEDKKPPAQPKPETAKKPDVGPKAGEDTPVPKPSTSSVLEPPKAEEEKPEESSASADDKSESDDGSDDESKKKTGRRRRRSS